VLVHDVWGLGDHTRDVAQRLAAEGFAVLALDLYRRRGEVEITDVGAWLRSLSDPEAIADVRAAAAFLRAQPASAGRAVGVVGFCMGGTVALLAACAAPELAAAVPFYGLLSHEHGLLYAERGLDSARKPRQPLDAVPDMACPGLFFFGDEDPYIPAADVEWLRQQLDGIDVASEVVCYPAAGHAFMNDARPDAYRPDAARDAWARMIAFLRRHLGD
jgi:carboxymethylenebutenolidase